MQKERINKNKAISIIIIIAILSLSVYIIIKDNSSPEITEELAKCIGENSILYSQTGCPACQKQEELFGENLRFINSIDCFLKENRQVCINNNIQATPTWIINNKEYRGVQSIQTLKSLTNC